MKKNKEYKIVFEETYNGVDIYLIPSGSRITMDSMWKTRIGYIDFDDKPNVFRFLDCKFLTLNVLKDIVSNWEIYNKGVIENESNK
tara:strand:+ start:1440 stop:1697 length:258 start_codon:yes stop_codon:yes gene_type:complete